MVSSPRKTHWEYFHSFGEPWKSYNQNPDIQGKACQSGENIFSWSALPPDTHPSSFKKADTHSRPSQSAWRWAYHPERSFLKDGFLLIFFWSRIYKWLADNQSKSRANCILSIIWDLLLLSTLMRWISSLKLSDHRNSVSTNPLDVIPDMLIKSTCFSFPIKMCSGDILSTNFNWL